MAHGLNLEYPAILAHFGRHLIPGRLESRAFLGWFLENYYRLAPDDAEDSICDGPDDKGIDGIYVDRNFEQVTLFQAKLYQNPDKSVGESSLRDFVGAIDQFKDEDSIKWLVDSTNNIELKGLINDQKIGELIRTGYGVNGVFITNGSVNANGVRYANQNSQLTIRDRGYLESNWIDPSDKSPQGSEITFHLEGLGIIRYKTPEAEAYFAPLSATELVTLEGIESQALFDWNVRKSLGRTKVNKEIAASVADQSEHKNFLLYHNGLTVIAEDVETGEDTITLRGYSVVNGCQSLSTLNGNRAKISPELRLMAKIIKISPNDDLSAKITRNSNNQNATNARDLQSNSVTQRRLQQEFKEAFPTTFGYEIKRVEVLGCDCLITNEVAARVLLAFDLEQPYSCHQSYRYFDDLHSEIFNRPEVNAYRIVALFAVYNAVKEGLQELLADKLVAGYSVTPFFVLYLVRSALMLDELGQKFCRDPKQFLDCLGFEGVKRVIAPIVEDLIIDLNGEITERTQASDPFDHKRELKSATAVRKLQAAIIPSYQKAIRRHRASSFTEEYNNAVSVG
jgi:AIPR protein